MDTAVISTAPVPIHPIDLASLVLWTQIEVSQYYLIHSMLNTHSTLLTPMPKNLLPSLSIKVIGTITTCPPERVMTTRTLPTITADRLQTLESIPVNLAVTLNLMIQALPMIAWCLHNKYFSYQVKQRILLSVKLSHLPALKQDRTVRAMYHSHFQPVLIL